MQFNPTSSSKIQIEKLYPLLSTYIKPFPVRHHSFRPK